jgi:hypothetical protein
VTGHPKIVSLSPQASPVQNQRDFSLVLGGPLYQIYLATKLAGPSLQLLVRRVLVISFICWLPPLLLAAIDGHLTGGVPVPFLRDPMVHVRFLLALPLLIASECYAHERMRMIGTQFLTRGIITAENRARFEEIVASNTRLRNSAIAEVILLVLAFASGYWLWRQNLLLTVSSWYALVEDSGPRLTAAGWCYVLFSLCIFRFILYRWYFRLFIWYRFLWKVSALPLHLSLYHPDRVGGLGFLSGSALALAPVFVAQTILVAGFIFTHILYRGATLPSFKTEILGIFVWCVVVLVLPLGFFSVKLARAGRTARREFGILASRYVDDFRRKWIEDGARTEEPLLGTADIQSLADLANSFEVVNRTRLIPISKETLVRLVVMVGLPLLPLTLTMFPLEELVRRLFKLAF